MKYARVGNLERDYDKLAALGVDEMQLPAGGAGDGLICVVTVPGIVRAPGRYMNPLVGASE
jgi:hypothetical protein